MLPSGIISVTKHWLLVGYYPWQYNHVSDETPTTCWMLSLGIMSVTNHWLLVGCYPWESCPWVISFIVHFLLWGFFLLHSLRKFFPETCITLECRYSCFWHKRSQDHLNRLNLLFNCVYFTDMIPEGIIWQVVSVSALTWLPRVISDK